MLFFRHYKYNLLCRNLIDIWLVRFFATRIVSVILFWGAANSVDNCPYLLNTLQTDINGECCLKKLSLILYFIGKLDIFPLMCLADKVLITELASLTGVLLVIMYVKILSKSDRCVTSNNVCQDLQQVWQVCY
jgi:hypothetical protein